MPSAAVSDECTVGAGTFGMLPDGSELNIVKDATALTVLLGNAPHVLRERQRVVLITGLDESRHSAQHRGVASA